MEKNTNLLLLKQNLFHFDSKQSSQSQPTATLTITTQQNQQSPRFFLPNQSPLSRRNFPFQDLTKTSSSKPNDAKLTTYPDFFFSMVQFSITLLMATSEIWERISWRFEERNQHFHSSSLNICFSPFLHYLRTRCS